MNGLSLGPRIEVYDAEILELCGGLEAALTSPMVGLISGIHICTDNLSVAQKAGSIPNGSSQAGFARFKEAAQRWVQHGRRIIVQWVPSHIGIQNNEKADIKAKKHAETLSTAATEETQTLAHAQRVICQKKDQVWLKGWETKGASQAVKYYQELNIQPTTNVKAMPEVNLSRKVLGWLIAGKSGHGHFADYHERFGHEEEDIRCNVGRDARDFTHFRAPHRARLFSMADKRLLTTKEVLGTTQGVKMFAEWAPRTELFQKKRGHDKLARL